MTPSDGDVVWPPIAPASIFAALDVNDNGALDRVEVYAFREEVLAKWSASAGNKFGAIPRNEEGQVSYDAFAAFYESEMGNTAVWVRPHHDGWGYTPFYCGDGDCDDNEEIMDGRDNDCDGMIDEDGEFSRRLSFADDAPLNADQMKCSSASCPTLANPRSLLPRVSRSTSGCTS